MSSHVLQDTSQYEGPSLCQWYTACDHAVIVSGAWNTVTQSRNLGHENAELFSKMLKNNGFLSDKVDVFQRTLPYKSE